MNDITEPAEMRPDRPLCAGCKKRPDELFEYVSMAQEVGMSAEQYVVAEEGTLDQATGLFLCTPCYIRHGQPAGRSIQWTATTANLAALGLL